MRIALVGTSNSILKDGFSTALASNPLTTAFGNFSIGASSSVHIVKSTAEVDFSAYDFCLFEFAINEDVLLRAGATSPEQVNRNVSYLAARCLQAGCLPVVVIFPKPMKLEMSQSRDFYRGFARTLNLPFLDGYEVVNALREQNGLTKEELFLDKAHVNKWVGRFIGDIVLHGLSQIWSEKEERVEENWEAGIPGQIVLGSTETVSTDSVHRKNSKFEDVFQIVRGETALEVSGFEPGSCVLGICVNLSQTSCVLAVEGETTCLIDLRNQYFENPKYNLTISLLPLLRSVEPRDGKINLRCVNIGELGESLIPMKGVYGVPLDPTPTNILEISRLLVQKPESIKMPQKPSTRLHLDLFSTCPEKERLAIYTKHYSIPSPIPPLSSES